MEYGKSNFWFIIPPKLLLHNTLKLVHCTFKKIHKLNFSCFASDIIVVYILTSPVLIFCWVRNSNFSPILLSKQHSNSTEFSSGSIGNSNLLIISCIFRSVKIWHLYNSPMNRILANDFFMSIVSVHWAKIGG